MFGLQEAEALGETVCGHVLGHTGLRVALRGSWVVSQLLWGNVIVTSRRFAGHIKGSDALRFLSLETLPRTRCQASPTALMPQLVSLDLGCATDRNTYVQVGNCGSSKS